MQILVHTPSIFLHSLKPQKPHLSVKYIFVFFLYLIPAVCFTQDFYQQLYEAESKTRTSDLQAAFHLYEQASTLGTLSPESLYNLSCLYGKAGDSVKAYQYLAKAIEAGFGNSDYIKMEPALQALHSGKDWQKLLAKADRNDEVLLEKMQQKEQAENYPITKLFTPQELQEDLALLWKGMQEAHPGFTWYTSQQTLDSAWRKLVQQCQKPQTVTSFYARLWRTVNLVRDVHSETTLPKAVNQQFLAQPVFFPIPVKFLHHKCYVNLTEGTTYPFHFGDEILSIDGHPTAEIERKLQELVVTDGYTTTGKQRIVNRLFYKLYSIAYAPAGQVVVRYRNAARKMNTATVPLMKKTEVDTVYRFRYPELNDSVAGRYYTAEGVPVLKLNTFSLLNFSSSGMDYYHFLDSAFTDLQTRNAQSLIIDLRQNNGGDEQLLQDLLGYLLEKPWQPYRSAFVKTRNFDFLAYTDDWATGAAERIKIEFQKDSTGVFSRKSDWANFATVKQNRFKGKLVVLIGGLDVSAGSSFPSLLYQNKPETLFVGEETAGGFYGNNSSYYLVLTLPHTRIHYKIPLVQLRLNVAGMPIGRGLQPQYPVQETMSNLKEGNDPALKKAIELARK